ncbi:MAG: tetratricopeptide repeat protein [Candidatus Rokubacteria bacterium]|nr:tetratricopeptide repeat protein [Candidatus Rokubacteria bacterium]
MRTLLTIVTLLALPVLVHAAGSAKKEESKTPGVTADARYNEGVDHAKAAEWSQAELAFREATMRRPKFPEAWNGLGHALKMQRKFPDALKAYDEALRQRPDYPEALEYLGETYVAMGRPDDARTTLVRLRPVDAKLGERLEKVIAEGKPSTNW